MKCPWVVLPQQKYDRSSASSFLFGFAPRTDLSNIPGETNGSFPRLWDSGIREENQSIEYSYFPPFSFSNTWSKMENFYKKNPHEYVDSYQRLINVREGFIFWERVIEHNIEEEFCKKSKILLDILVFSINYMNRNLCYLKALVDWPGSWFLFKGGMDWCMTYFYWKLLSLAFSLYTIFSSSPIDFHSWSNKDISSE